MGAPRTPPDAPGLALRDVGIETAGLVLQGLSVRFEAGVHRIQGPPALVDALGRVLAHETLPEGTRVWGAITLGGIDHRICRPLTRVRPLRAREGRPLTVRAMLLGHLPPDAALDVLATPGAEPRRARADASLRAHLHAAGIGDLPLDRIATTLPPEVVPRLALAGGLARQGPGLWWDVHDLGAPPEALADAPGVAIVVSSEEGATDLGRHVVAQPPLPPAPRWFRWIQWRALAGMSRPGASCDAAAVRDWLTAADVQRVVGLEETSFALSLEGSGIPYTHFPIVDMEAPAVGACRELVASLAHERVVFHCKAGLGRTGTLLAASLIHRGYRTDQALSLLRNIERLYVQTEAQERFLRAFEEAA